MKARTWLLGVFIVAATGIAAHAEDLFAEAGHARAHSRWVTVRLLPMIEIALEADDVVLVQSILHPAKSFAIKLDKEAFAADCAVTEEKANTYSVVNSQNKWTVASSSTSKTYWASCHFEEGMAEKALAAKSITVQLAMTNGTTKPHKLNTKELRKFQTLDQ